MIILDHLNPTNIVTVIIKVVNYDNNSGVSLMKKLIDSMYIDGNGILATSIKY